VLHILSLELNLISISKMSDARVHTLFQKDTCKMVRGEMVLIKGVQIGTLYKLLKNVNSTGCNNIIVTYIPDEKLIDVFIGTLKDNIQH
jgi:hypothetical protein